MPSESKPLLTTQTEKPNHYSYLKEFRVEQCPLFLQHKCTQHRPYTCFHWHFMNQRRRRPVRKRDGSFNYSADNYCTKFDETTGLCPAGDECQFLHRTAGDTERRYHLRYYKTCMCVHDTDSRGFCVKNGSHCAFAHGSHDLRPPVYDIKEMQALEGQDSDPTAALNGPNVLDKERSSISEDPKWQDSGFVLANYKTEQCKRPPRLCRQGYACPQYHNTRDKRRNPKRFKYRSTPCPNVKHGDEWGEPGNCESGDLCGYCHTRTEQQFHPEIYKSTKCNDVLQAGYCPRGSFCAFAHIDQEMSGNRDDAATGTNLADILSNALPPDTTRKDEFKCDSSNGSGEVSESASESSIGSNSSNKAPGSQLSNQNKIHTSSSLFSNNHLHNNHDIFSNSILHKTSLLKLDNNSLLGKSDKNRTGVYFPSSHSNGILGPFYNSDTVESVVGNALDDISLEDPLNLASIDRDIEADSPVLSGSITAGLANTGSLGGSDPVNIPSSGLGNRNNSTINFSPNTSSPLNPMTYLASSRFQQDVLEASQWQTHLPSSKLGNFHSSIYDFGQNVSPHHPVSSPLVTSYNMGSSPVGLETTTRLELIKDKHKIANLEQTVTELNEKISRMNRDTEDNVRFVNLAEKQRDEALNQAANLQKEIEGIKKNPFAYAQVGASELKNLSIASLKQLQGLFRNNLDQIDQALFNKTGKMCMVCEENVRCVTLVPCNHLLLCTQCSLSQKECPYCQVPLQINSNNSL